MAVVEMDTDTVGTGVVERDTDTVDTGNCTGLGTGVVAPGNLNNVHMAED